MGQRSGSVKGVRRAAFAVAVCALVLGGCGSDKKDSADSGSTTTTSAADDVTTTTAAASTTAATATTVAATSTTAATPADSSPILKETEIGPLRLGMSLDDAQATGWIGTDVGTCELAGPAPEGTAGYSLDGASAPADLDATVSFEDSKITFINVRGGARMANGVKIEPFGEWTPDLAMKALNLAGYEITYGTILEENDLAKVVSPDGNHYELSLAEAGVNVAVPGIVACE